MCEAGLGDVRVTGGRAVEGAGGVATAELPQESSEDLRGVDESSLN